MEKGPALPGGNPSPKGRSKPEGRGENLPYFTKVFNEIDEIPLYLPMAFHL